MKARFADQTLRFPLPKEPVHLGSAPDSGIWLPFPGVSRLHAVIEPVAGGIALRDLGSRNGLFFEGKRQRTALLAPGGEVGIGRTFLSLDEAATSNVELGLLLETGPAALPGGPNPVDRTATGSAASLRIESGAEDALRLIRECEAARDAEAIDPSWIVGRATAVLRATGLALWERNADGSVVFLAVRGIPALSEGPTDNRQIVWKRPLRPAAKDEGEAGLSATFASASEAAEPWRADLVAYLGRVLTGIPALSVSNTTRLDSESALVLPPGMVPGSSPAMRDFLAQVKSAAGSAIDILLTGETGTGKELIAHAIHASSSGRTGHLVTVNCAAIPAELLEAELFGIHGRVATGVDPRPGRLLLAEGGTVFLDEVGELAPSLQAKLLRFLQEREVHAIGAPAPKHVDLRVVAATNRDLRDDVRLGRFRADLFYRLRGLELHVPPLRERKEDIPELALAFARRASAESRKPVRGLTRRAVAALVKHEWPGNVRELEADVRRSVLLCPAGGSIAIEHLPGNLLHSPEVTHTHRDPRLHLAVEERRVLETALDEAGGNHAEAARSLGLKRTTFVMRLRRGRSEKRHDG